MEVLCYVFFFFSSRRRHTRLQGDWSSDVCSSDLSAVSRPAIRDMALRGSRRRASSASDMRVLVWAAQDIAFKPSRDVADPTWVIRAEARHGHEEDLEAPPGQGAQSHSPQPEDHGAPQG